jgi:hypothetical protein
MTPEALTDSWLSSVLHTDVRVLARAGSATGWSG